MQSVSSQKKPLLEGGLSERIAKRVNGIQVNNGVIVSNLPLIQIDKIVGTVEDVLGIVDAQRVATCDAKIGDNPRFIDEVASSLHKSVNRPIERAANRPIGFLVGFHQVDMFRTNQQ